MTIRRRDFVRLAGAAALSGGLPRIARSARTHEGKTVIKEETMPDGRRKLILKDEKSGEFTDVVA